MYTAGLDAWLDILSERGCEPKGHEKVAGGEKTSQGWNSNETAAYPADFNGQQLSRSSRRQSCAATPLRLIAPPEAVKPKESRPTTSGVPAVKCDIKAPTIHSEAPVENTNAPAETRVDTPTSGDDITRRLDFTDEDIVHEEPDAEELPGDAGPPAARKPRRKVTFEKTAGARATRANAPEVMRGLATSTGFAMIALGASPSTAVYAMGTVNLFDELSKPGNSLSRRLGQAELGRSQGVGRRVQPR